MMREDPKGRLKIFEKPNSTLRYAIGVDVSEGLETGDFSSAFVINSEYKQMASWHGKLDPDLLGKDMVKLAKYFNDAILAVEINNHGHATAAAIKNVGYGNVYVREVKEERSDQYTKKIGWQTNTKTKTKMLDEFVALYRDNLIEIRDVNLLKEMMELIVEPDGNVLLGGKDRVVAACISCQAIKQAGSTYKAYVPGKDEKKPRTLEEKLRYFARRSKRDTYFE